MFYLASSFPYVDSWMNDDMAARLYLNALQILRFECLYIFESKANHTTRQITAIQLINTHTVCLNHSSIIIITYRQNKLTRLNRKWLGLYSLLWIVVYIHFPCMGPFPSSPIRPTVCSQPADIGHPFGACDFIAICMELYPSPQPERGLGIPTGYIQSNPLTL